MEKNVDSSSEKEVELVEEKDSDIDNADNIIENDENDDVEEEENDKIGELPLSNRKFSGNLLKCTIGEQGKNENYPEVKLSKYSPVDFQEFFPIIHKLNNVRINF